MKKLSTIVRRGPLSVSVAMLLWLLAAGRPVPAADPPTFTYSLYPSSIVIEEEPGTAFQRELSIVLTVTNNTTYDGVSGWSYSLAAEGVRVIDATVQGTVGALTTDDPPGLRDPRHSFEATFVATDGEEDCAGRPGACGAVVLSTATHVELPANCSVAIARITVAGEVPPAIGEVARPRLLFVDGCSGWPGSYNDNGVTWQSMDHSVTETRGCDLEVRAAHREFRRGDANDDGVVDLSDALCILNCKFLGARCSDCRDSADIDDDGLLSTTDPIRLLGFLFLGTVAPQPPGIACGTDPVQDEYPPCIYASCSGS